MAHDDAPTTPQRELRWGVPLRWGEDEIAWGSDLSPAALIDRDVMSHLLIDADYVSDDSIRVWTGIGDLDLNGVTYTGIGPEVISVRIGQATEKEDARLQVTLAGLTEPETRRAFYEFRGRVVVTVRLIYSIDEGVSWLRVPRSFTGLYSRPRIQNDTVSFEVATYREQLDRGYEVEWSHANQRALHAGDNGLEHLKTIADGINLSWPP